VSGARGATAALEELEAGRQVPWPAVLRASSYLVRAREIAGSAADRTNMYELARKLAADELEP
jgi:hypothetical protein